MVAIPLVKRIIDPGRKVSLTAATSQFLDMSRWVAAFLVVFSHVRSLVLANYPDVIGRPTILAKGIYFAAGFGHQSVVIFFVISGFLVGGRALMKATAGGFSLQDYAIHRFARIYVVLVPALLIGLLYDVVGSSLVDDFGLYTNGSRFHWWMVDFAIYDRLGVRTLLGNFLLLQTIVVEPLGSNGPLWSLANEWWYYVVFGLAIAAFSPNKKLLQIMCFLGAALLLWQLPVAITVWLSLWLLGVAAALVEQRWRGWPASVGMVAFLAIMLGERLLPPQSDMLVQFVLDLLVAIGFSYALLCAKRGNWALRSLHPLMASFSYTTYLVHAPAMVLIVATVHRMFDFGIGEQPGPLVLIFMVTLIAVLYGYAWMFALMTERHTERVRMWVSRVANATFMSTSAQLLSPVRNPKLMEPTQVAALSQGKSGQ